MAAAAKMSNTEMMDLSAKNRALITQIWDRFLFKYMEGLLILKREQQRFQEECPIQLISKMMD